MLFGAYHYWRNTRISKLPEFDQEKYESFTQNIQSALKDKNNNSEYQPVPKYSNKEAEKILFPFDPNSDSFKELLRKGIPYDIVKNMVRYRDSGGQFQVKSDLLKLYSVDDHIYKKLEKYIQLSDTLPASESKLFVKKQATIRQVIDLNSADEKELQTVQGVGPSFAKWIVDRRERLGGFIVKDQLMEVYRMDTALYTKICKQTVLNDAGLTKMNINIVGYKVLYSHPYFSYKEAKAIVAYREQHGPFESTKELSKLYIFKGKDLDRLLPYLDVN